jgi:phage baseplate assembly protein W
MTTITAFGTPVYIAGDCDISYAYDLDFIKQAIGNIVMTRINELFLSDFGSRVALLLFEQNDDVATNLLKDEIRGPLREHLPIISITDTTIRRVEATAADRMGMSAQERNIEDHTLNLVIGFTVLTTGWADKVEIALPKAA